MKAQGSLNLMVSGLPKNFWKKQSLRSEHMTSVKYIDLGTLDYGEAWAQQQQVHERLVLAKTGTDKPDAVPVIFFVEHPHVYTLGKSGHENNLLINPDFLTSIGATFYHTDRGGDITYHGPGQIVGYPVLDLDMLGLGVKKYIFFMEEAIIQTLSDFGIMATRLDGSTGVWLDTMTPQARKICAIGVRVSRSVTMHGFALNVNTDLKYFNYINPCGFTDKGVTSMQKETGGPVDLSAVKQWLLHHFCDLLGINVIG
jgi:lipoyl(octanoyl) transferase